MPKIVTQEELIARFKEFHGDKFDYSKVEYKGMRFKVCIICPIHGEFWQGVKEHMIGIGCPKCAIMNNSSTLDEFIAKARKVHGDRYDYSKVVYINNRTPVCIICPVHGEFWQKPVIHLQSCGCIYCAKINKGEKNRLNTEEFIRRAREVHGDKFDYSKVDYKNSQTKVCIICPIHGTFWQRPSDHLRGKGCKECANEYNGSLHRGSLDTFIKESIKTHGNGTFSYELINSYQNCDTPVPIICPTHGIFYQSPYAHIHGQGCPHCKESHGERDIAKWLDEHNVKYDRQYKVVPTQVLFGRNIFKIDFYLPDHNTFIEFHGEQHYNKNKLFHRMDNDFADQQDRDRRLREHCKQHKIRLIEIPYTEFDNIDKILKKKIK